MDNDCSSDEEVVISHFNPGRKVKHGVPQSSNNNSNGREIEGAKMDQFYGLERASNSFSLQNGTSEKEFISLCAETDSALEPCEVPKNGLNNNQEDDVTEDETSHFHVSLQEQLPVVLEKEDLASLNNCDKIEGVKSGSFHKSSTFPFSDDVNSQGWLDSLPPFQSIKEDLPHLGKRLLPPIEKVAIKRHRTLSGSAIVAQNGSAQETLLPTIEGSPIKSSFYKSDEEVKFVVGDEDQFSDQDSLDTSTSSNCDAVSSSSLEEKGSEQEKEEDENEEQGQNMEVPRVAERLQDKFLKVLKLDEVRSKSPTASIASAPIFPNTRRLSLSDDEDTQSVVSDSKLVRTSAGKVRKSTIRQRSTPEDLIIRRSLLDSTDYMAEAEEVNFCPGSGLGDEVLDDEVSESPSTRSAGILPAISSHRARERSFLVGNLTKHGSLLGADELNKYFPDRMLKLFVGTWNMQRKGIPRNLNDFLLPKHEEYLQDMYVIGVQESTQDQKKWEIKLQETLGVSHVLAHSVSHGVLHLAVFVRRDLIWFCSPFEDDRVTTRMVSRIKTKGAVAIAFQFFGTSLIFITSHFHSGETRVKERVEDYNRIKEKIKLPKTLQWDAYKTSPNDVTSRFDCAFWFGDLNFRVSLPHQIIHDEVNDPDNYDLKEVLKGDQLMAIMKRGRIFPGFMEPKIKFRPTYKFTAGSDKYDTSAKMRVPSYTDRILFKCKDNDAITCNRYDSVSTLKKSDHRPVYGFYEVCLKPGRDSIPFGGGKFRNDVYEKAAKVRARQGNFQNNSAVCNIL